MFTAIAKTTMLLSKIVKRVLAIAENSTRNLLIFRIYNICIIIKICVPVLALVVVSNEIVSPDMYNRIDYNWVALLSKLFASNWGSNEVDDYEIIMTPYFSNICIIIRMRVPVVALVVVSNAIEPPDMYNRIDYNWVALLSKIFATNWGSNDVDDYEITMTP
jgi:hypothetical protein